MELRKHIGKKLKHHRVLEGGCYKYKKNGKKHFEAYLLSVYSSSY